MIHDIISVRNIQNLFAEVGLYRYIILRFINASSAHLAPSILQRSKEYPFRNEL
jgi:hypothetical protein